MVDLDNTHFLVYEYILEQIKELDEISVANKYVLDGDERSLNRL
jgi:hypothetical protein